MLFLDRNWTNVQWNIGGNTSSYSTCPVRYRVEVLERLLHREYHISNDWETFYLEIVEITTSRGNLSMEREIISFNQILEWKTTVFILSKMTQVYFFENQMSSIYMTELIKLQNLVDQQLSNVHSDSKFKLRIYYRTM